MTRGPREPGLVYWCHDREKVVTVEAARDDWSPHRPQFVERVNDGKHEVVREHNTPWDKRNVVLAQPGQPRDRDEERRRIEAARRRRFEAARRRFNRAPLSELGRDR